MRVSNIKPLCTKMMFNCNMCGDCQSLALTDGKYTVPTKVNSILFDCALPAGFICYTLCCLDV